MLQAGDELPEELVGHVLDHVAATELRRLAGDAQVGGDVDVRGPGSGLGHRRGDLGAGGAVAPLVLAPGVDHHPVGRLVLLDERAGAVVDQRDRTELDLHGAREGLRVGLGDRRPREAPGHSLDVVEVGPGLLDAGRDGEPVVQLHARSASRGREHGAAGQHRRQVPAVVGVAVEVRRRVGALGGQVGRGAYAVLGRRGARERLLDRARPDRRGAHVGEPDPRLGDGAALDPDRRRDGDDRPLVHDPDELLVVGAPPGVLGHPDLGQDLVLADRGLEEVHEEVRGRDGAAAAAAGDHELGAQRQRAGPEVARRVGVGERPAEGPAVPDLGVGQLVGRLGDHARVLAHQVARADVVVRGHRADDERVAVVADPAQRVDPAEVDHRLRGVEPHPEHRQQALPAGDDLGVVTVLGEGRQRVLDRGRRHVVELGGNHSAPPAFRSTVPSMPVDSSKCGAAAPVVGSSPRLPRRGSPATPARACTASGCPGCRAGGRRRRPR